jgi:hypothetical protein
MESLEQIAHSTECRFNYAVETESEGGLQYSTTRTGQEQRIREAR